MVLGSKGGVFGLGGEYDWREIIEKKHPIKGRKQSDIVVLYILSFLKPLVNRYTYTLNVSPVATEKEYHLKRIPATKRLPTESFVIFQGLRHGGFEVGWLHLHPDR